MSEREDFLDRVWLIFVNKNQVQGHPLFANCEKRDNKQLIDKNKIFTMAMKYLSKYQTVSTAKLED